MEATAKQSVQVVIRDNEILLSGVLNFDTTPKVLRLLRHHLKQVHDKRVLFILNLHEITKSDSSGLALLMGLVREAKRNDVMLKISNIPKNLMNLASLSGLETVFPLI